MKKKPYEGRIPRTLSLLEMRAKKLFEDEQARMFLWDHVDKDTYDIIYEGVIRLAGLREELHTYVRE